MIIITKIMFICCVKRDCFSHMIRDMANAFTSNA